MRAGESFRLAKIIHILGSQNEQATCYITSWNFFFFAQIHSNMKIKAGKKYLTKT